MWKNPSTKKEEEKQTYVKYLPEANWYVASGVYLDELDLYIQKQLEQDSKYDKTNINIIIIASVILLIFSLVLSIAMSAIIKNIFIYYKKSILSEVEKTKEIEKTKQKYEILSHTDSLTNMHNRFSIMKILDEQLSSSKNKNRPLSLIMFDLDYFKQINDKYGHSAGDSVLVEISELVKENLRDADCVGRYGGEEFLVTLPNTDLDISKIIANRIRQKVEKFKFKSVESVTISIGLIEVSKDESRHEVLKRVDKLLYKAKEQGRNRVCF
jgi:diguanylate cyclase (GGDEF)-like protein